MKEACFIRIIRHGKIGFHLNFQLKNIIFNPSGNSEYLKLRWVKSKFTGAVKMAFTTAESV